MKNQFIETNLEVRKILRDQDEDLFIETLSYPINLELEIENMSRIQFPLSRAILVRTSFTTSWVTVHVMRDIDLYSSFANFELNLEGKRLVIQKQEGYIQVYTKNVK